MHRNKILNGLGRHKFALLAVFALLICGLFAYRQFSFNDAQHKAGFIAQFAKAQHLEQFSSYGDPGNGPDNAVPNYGSYYKSTTPLIDLKNSLKSFLQQKGYWVKTVLVNPGCSYTSKDYCGARPPTNDGQPYWAVDAGSKNLLIVVTITDKTYEDASSGEKPDPKGYNVLHFDFAEPGTNPNWY